MIILANLWQKKGIYGGENSPLFLRPLDFTGAPGRTQNPGLRITGPQTIVPNFPNAEIPDHIIQTGYQPILGFS